MEVTNCRSCGRLFNVLSNETICPNCQKKLDDKFKEVKEFLDENPNASVEKVSRETHTSTKQIRKWIREERLILSDGVLDGITCDRCGKPIRTGKYCDQCKTKMANTLLSAFEKPAAPSANEFKGDGRMRYISDDK